MTPIADVTGCVLAGGRSRRMGRDKASLELAGETLAARAVRVLRSVFERALAATIDPRPFAALGVEVVPDRLGEGPLAGIAALLAAATTERVFVCAVDMPFLEERVVRRLCELARGADAVLPEGNPLCAVYSKRCLPAFEARLAAGRFGVEAAVGEMAREGGLEVRILAAGELPADEWAFFNLNEPFDLPRAAAELERRRARGRDAEDERREMRYA